MGGAGWQAWRLVNLPFREEYPGGRQWNRDAAQFKYQPAELADDEAPRHPHWDKICDHIGTELTPALKDLPWAEQAGIRTGADYLRAWAACAFRCPFNPTPYLFLFGSENCGKSIFYESLQLLVTKGVVKADRPLTGRDGFNGELAGAIISRWKRWMSPSAPVPTHASRSGSRAGPSTSAKCDRTATTSPTPRTGSRRPTHPRTARCSPATLASP